MRDYADYSRDELLARVRELEMLTQQLLEEQQQETRLDFSWSGNLGHWYWNVEANSVVFHPLKVTALGFSLDEVPEEVTYQFFTDRLHPDDHERVMQTMRDHLTGKLPVYEVEYRIRAKDGSWKWFYDRGKVTRRSEAGKPLFLAGIVFDVTESKQYEKALESQNIKLQRAAGADALTGIHNRRAVIEELERKLRISNIQKRPLSVGMFDIDHFKDVNDSKGHVFGDAVLKGVADQLYATVREKDTVGRYGGEEFLVVFFDASASEAAAVANRIRKRVELYDFGKGFTVTVSGGIAEYANQSLEELIDEADRRLYTAKKQGRNQIVS